MDRCENNAEWQIEIVLYPTGWHTPVHGRLMLIVCEAHRLSLRISDVVNTSTYDAVNRRLSMVGGPPIDRSRTRLRFYAPDDWQALDVESPWVMGR